MTVLLKKMMFLTLLSFIWIANGQKMQIPIEKGEKIKKTFSEKVDEITSFHAIVLKDKKKGLYVVKSYLIIEDKGVIPVVEKNFKHEPSVYSYHMNRKDLFTVIFLEVDNNTGNKTLHIIDYNFNTKNTNSQIFSNYEMSDYTFKLPKKSLMMSIDKKREFYTITIVNSATDIKEIKGRPNPKDMEQFKTFFKSHFDYVDLDKYNIHGSYHENKVCHSDNALHFINLNPKTVETTFIDIDLYNPSTFTLEKITPSTFDKIRGSNVYYKANKLFYILNYKKNVYLRIVDIDTKEILHTANVSVDYAHLTNDSFLKKFNFRATSTQFYAPTITAYKTTEENWLLNLGWIDKRVYYNNDWWFQHQQMMWMMNQPILNVPRFGPNPPEIVMVLEANDDEQHFQVVLNENFEVVDNATHETKNRSYYNEKYYERLNNKTIKHGTIVFLPKSLRVMYYDKNRGEFQITKSNYN